MHATSTSGQDSLPLFAFLGLASCSFPLRDLHPRFIHPCVCVLFYDNLILLPLSFYLPPFCYPLICSGGAASQHRAHCDGLERLEAGLLPLRPQQAQCRPENLARSPDEW